MSDDTPGGITRRDLIKTVAGAGAGLGLAQLGFPSSADAAPIGVDDQTPPPPAGASMIGVQFEPRDVVRVAVVGTGLRGGSTLNELLGVGNVRITALCDIVPEKVEKAKAMMKKAGHDYEPAV